MLPKTSDFHFSMGGNVVSVECPNFSHINWIQETGFVEDFSMIFRISSSVTTLKFTNTEIYLPEHSSGRTDSEVM